MSFLPPSAGSSRLSSACTFYPNRKSVEKLIKNLQTTYEWQNLIAKKYYLHQLSIRKGRRDRSKALHPASSRYPGTVHKKGDAQW